MFLDIFRRKKTPAKTTVYRTIALSFFGLSTVIALIVFYISFSWATIRLEPQVQPVTSTVQVAVQEASDEQGTALPGRIIQKDLEGIGTYTPTVSQTKPDRMAGVVTVVNTTARNQALRSTTRFLTPNQVLFRSTESVIVPARGQIAVSVQAEKEGDLGAVDTARFTIPGLWEPLQNQIYGASFTATQGGERVERTVTREDIARAEETIVKKLEEKFALLLDAEKSSFAAPAVGALFRSDITARTSDHALGERADEFTVRLTVRFTAALYNEQTMQERLRESLSTLLSSGYQLTALQSDHYRGSFESFDSVQRRALLSVAVTGGKIRTDDVRSYHTRDLAGLKKEAIVEYFRGYDDIKDVSVSFSPFWVTRAPLLVDHIKIVVDTKTR